MAKKIKKFLTLVLIFGLIANLAMVTGFAAGDTYIYNSSDGHGNSNKLPFDKCPITIYIGDTIAEGDEGLNFADSGSGTWKAVSAVGELNIGNGSLPVIVKYTDKQGNIQYYYASLVKHSGGNQSDSGGATDNYEFGGAADHAVTSVTVNKVWDDAYDKDGIRPASITVNLLANGNEYASATLSAETGWTYTFDDLPDFINDVPVVYTVDEVEVPEGYTSVVNGYTITNTHTPATTPVDPPVNPEPEKISVSGVKTWAGDEAAENVRPAEITVNLMVNDKVIDTAVVSEDTQWSYNFTGLAKYDDAGAEIVYTIAEAAVEGYTASYTKTDNGYDILNTYVPEVTPDPDPEPEMITIAGIKTWAGDEGAADVRPESITVNLYANGQQIESMTVTAGTQWTYNFGEYLKYDNDGIEISYTVAEVAVENYTATVNGYNITNTYNAPKTPSYPPVVEEIPDVTPPTTNLPEVEEEEEVEEVFEEEDVPMADVPETGDPTALWAVASVVSAAGILFIGKKNKDEE